MERHYLTGSLLLAAAFVAAGNVPSARADGKSKAAGELARFVLRKFGAKAVAEGGEALARRIATSAAKHGDDVFHAVRRIGPRALSLADDAGKHAPHVLKFVAKHGDDAAAVMSKQSMKLLSLGDDAGRALLRHKAVVVSMLETYGGTAARALATVTPQNGRRLVMLAKTFDRMQQTKKVVEVVGKYGDKAVNWMWANKGALATAAACSAFLADPEGFMSGARKLTDTVVKEVVVPVSSAAFEAGAKLGDSILRHAIKPVVTELSRAAARSIPWGTLAGLGLAGFAGLASLAAWRLRSFGLAAAAVRARRAAPGY